MREKFAVSYIKSSRITISKKEAEILVKEYLEDIMGVNCSINNEGKLEKHIGWVQGLGQTTDMGIPTKEQLAATVLLKSLDK